MRESSILADNKNMLSKLNSCFQVLDVDVFCSFKLDLNYNR